MPNQRKLENWALFIPVYKLYVSTQFLSCMPKHYGVLYCTAVIKIASAVYTKIETDNKL